VFAPGFVVEDHRPVALFGSLSRDDWVASARALVDLRPNVRFRVEHALAVDDGLSLNVAGWVGDEPDGAFEILPVVVTEHGADGIRRWHVYELDRFDAARACYDALAANAPPRPENAATRLTGRFAAAWAARDWEGLASLFAPGFRMTDRRRYAQLDLDRDRHLESLRFRFEMRSSSTALEVLATRGHRLALLHQRFELADGDVGPSETESVNVAESDEHGRFATLVTFDADQLDAAYAELDRRYADEAAHGQVALWMGAAFRPLGWETRDAALARGVDLRPDPLRIPPNAATRASERQRKGLELTVLATAGDRLALERVRCSHANDGTPVSQTETLSLTEIDADGRIVAVLDFDADDRRAASAELRDRYARSDAASAPAAMFEAFRAFNDHDLDRFRATLHNDFVFHDHRRTGVGTLARADYLASIPPLFEAAPDIC
jgi:hypothetical protein